MAAARQLLCASWLDSNNQIQELLFRHLRQGNACELDISPRAWTLRLNRRFNPLLACTSFLRKNWKLKLLSSPQPYPSIPATQKSRQNTTPFSTDFRCLTYDPKMSLVLSALGISPWTRLLNTSAADKRLVSCWRGSCSKSLICSYSTNRPIISTSKCSNGWKTGWRPSMAQH